MSKAMENLETALQRAMAIRPTLRQAGVTRNIWPLPACQSLYLTEVGAVVAATRLLGAADRPGREWRLPRVSGCLLVRRGCSLRCRLRRSHRPVLRVQREAPAFARSPTKLFAEHGETAL
jgi:hypothetical protein